MKEHKKLIEKGIPEDVPPGLLGVRVSKHLCTLLHAEVEVGQLTL